MLDAVGEIDEKVDMHLYELTHEQEKERFKSGYWECINVCPGSGWVKSVAPTKMCRHVPVRPWEGSKKNV